MSRRAAAAGLAAALVLAAMLVLPDLRRAVSFDATVAYLPLAQRLLHEGLAFFGTPDSVMYAPLAYAWPALLGGTEAVVRGANVVLFLVTIALAWHAATIAHSRAAGVAAAFIAAISPELRLYAADALTEPLFIFLVAAWAASVAHVAREEEPHPRAWLAMGALALALAPLSRPALMLLAPIVALGCAAWAWRARDGRRRVAIRLAILHALAVLGPLAWTLHNHAVHGVASVANGLGGALWLGINPWTDGFDPIYYGLNYDTGALARGIPHLGTAAEHILRGAALLEIRDLPFSVLWEMAAHKVAAFVTVTGMETTVPVAPHRAWRLAALAFAVAAVAWSRRGALLAALVIFAAYMTAVHVPLLYNHRYSIGALDLPLAILAGIGVAEALRDRGRAIGTAIAAALCVGIGLVSLEPAPGAPHVERAPGQVLVSGEISRYDGVVARNASATEPGRYTMAPRATFDIPVRFDPARDQDHTATILGLAVTPAPRTTGCEWLRVRYRAASEPEFTGWRVARVPVQADGAMHALVVGTTIPLGMRADGVLRLEFECSGPATLETGRITVVSPRRAWVYHDLWMARQPR